MFDIPRAPHLQFGRFALNGLWWRKYWLLLSCLEESPVAGNAVLDLSLIEKDYCAKPLIVCFTTTWLCKSQCYFDLVMSDLIFKIMINTLRPRQNGHHFPDDIFKRIFLNENVWISIAISLKFVPKVPIDTNPALVQIMAWRLTPTNTCVTRAQWVKAKSVLTSPGHPWFLLSWHHLYRL